MVNLILISSNGTLFLNFAVREVFTHSCAREQEIEAKSNHAQTRRKLLCHQATY
jgi:hypothetical protein